MKVETFVTGRYPTSSVFVEAWNKVKRGRISNGLADGYMKHAVEKERGRIISEQRQLGLSSSMPSRRCRIPKKFTYALIAD